MLLPKAKGAMAKYGVHLVVANMLQTRGSECVLVSNASPTSHGELVRAQLLSVASAEAPARLEKLIVASLQAEHTKWQRRLEERE